MPFLSGNITLLAPECRCSGIPQDVLKSLNGLIVRPDLVKRKFLWNHGTWSMIAMNKEKSKSSAQVKTDARQARLEEALRQNLAKRKAQARERKKNGDKKENT